jgi:mono/diheme cytochrome c family protein
LPAAGGLVILLRMKASLALVLILAAACGSKSPTPATPGGEAQVALPDVPFDRLDHEQRIAFMKQKVMPAMTPIFKNHDPKDFAEFGCTTCHGPGAKDGHFDMPNAGLPKLDFQHLDKFKQADLEWMGKEVMPTMAKLLGQEPYSEANPKGFGCLECHTAEGAPPPSAKP